MRHDNMFDYCNCFVDGVVEDILDIAFRYLDGGFVPRAGAS